MGLFKVRLLVFHWINHHLYALFKCLKQIQIIQVVGENRESDMMFRSLHFITPTFNNKKVCFKDLTWFNYDLFIKKMSSSWNLPPGEVISPWRRCWALAVLARSGGDGPLAFQTVLKKNKPGLGTKYVLFLLWSNCCKFYCYVFFDDRIAKKTDLSSDGPTAEQLERLRDDADQADNARGLSPWRVCVRRQKWWHPNKLLVSFSFLLHCSTFYWWEGVWKIVNLETSRKVWGPSHCCLTELMEKQSPTNIIWAVYSCFLWAPLQ